MDLYEYQGKQFFAQYDIPVSPGEAVTEPSTTPSRPPIASATRSS